MDTSLILRLIFGFCSLRKPCQSVGINFYQHKIDRWCIWMSFIDWYPDWTRSYETKLPQIGPTGPVHYPFGLKKHDSENISTEFIDSNHIEMWTRRRKNEKLNTRAPACSDLFDCLKAPLSLTLITMRSIVWRRSI